MDSYFTWHLASLIVTILNELGISFMDSYDLDLEVIWGSLVIYRIIEEHTIQVQGEKTPILSLNGRSVNEVVVIF